MDAQGALDSLLGRLTTVLANEAQLLGGLRGDVEFIRDEMESMNGLLLHLTESQNRDHQVRSWMKQVVGLSRDCEGNVELYIRHIGGGRNHSKGILGYLRRISHRVRTMPVRHRIATRIRELKVRARDVGDRRERYGVTVPLPRRTGLAIIKPPMQPGGPVKDEVDDQRRRKLLLYGESPDYVGVGVNVVLEWLIPEEVQGSLQENEVHDKDSFEQQKKIICIAGRIEGIRSIAMKVFEHPSVMKMFHYKVWINMDRRQRYTDEILKEILKELVCQAQMASFRKEDMKSIAKEHLSGKRFLLVLDGIYPAENYWEELYKALLRDFEDFGCTTDSRIVLTTRNLKFASMIEGSGVSTFNCSTRQNLFDARAMALASSNYSEVMYILNECRHDAYALQIFLHLLYVNPYRSVGELRSFVKTIESNKNNAANTMLIFCYNELPSNYKSCFLYLSIFPQDHVFRRSDLLRRWAAEGLITKRSIGMSILDELIARGLIQHGEISVVGSTKIYIVHREVHEFITMIAADVNFVDTDLPPLLARHLSINNRIGLQASQSAVPLDDKDSGIVALLPSLANSPEWQVLKVLDLEGCKGLKNKQHLKNICKILLLRYLSLRNTDVTELPKQIENLQCLETFDIRQTAAWAFATKSIMLPMMKNLLAGQKDSPNNNPDSSEESSVTLRLPSGIGRSRNLEILSHVEVHHNINDLIELGQLLQLRKLGVVLPGKKGDLALLFQAIEKLCHCLRSLSIRINQATRSEGTNKLDFMMEVPVCMYV